MGYYCYDDCQQTSDHKFEFKGKCYHECPEGTHIILKDISAHFKSSSSLL